MPQNLGISSKGFEGLDDKIAVITGYYDQSLTYGAVRALADSLAFNDRGLLDIRGFYDKLRALVHYLPDTTGAEFIKAPWIMAEEIQERGFASGDCDDLASFAYALLHSVGVPAELYVAWYGREQDPSHIFVGVPQKSGVYYAFDLCARVYGQTIPGLSKVEAYA